MSLNSSINITDNIILITVPPFDLIHNSNRVQSDLNNSVFIIVDKKYCGLNLKKETNKQNLSTPANSVKHKKNSICFLI